MAFLFKKVETFLLGKSQYAEAQQFKIDSAARFALLVRPKPVAGLRDGGVAGRVVALLVGVWLAMAWRVWVAWRRGWHV